MSTYEVMIGIAIAVGVGIAAWIISMVMRLMKFEAEERWSKRQDSPRE